MGGSFVRRKYVHFRLAYDRMLIPLLIFYMKVSCLQYPHQGNWKLSDYLWRKW
jgi:hypothetical protein